MSYENKGIETKEGTYRENDDEIENRKLTKALLHTEDDAEKWIQRWIVNESKARKQKKVPIKKEMKVRTENESSPCCVLNLM